jgi:hypothetical protein
MAADLTLDASVKTYLVICHAEGCDQATMGWYSRVLNGFIRFTGEMDLNELDAMHILLHLSTERAMTRRHPVVPLPAKEFIVSYAPLFRFLRWLSMNRLISLQLPASLRSMAVDQTKPATESPKNEHPPEMRGCHLN